MTGETMARLKKMNQDEKQTRFDQLNATIGAPHMVNDGGKPSEHSQEVLEEWAWLKEDLARS
jgi:DhnA family fructose-bisphosphate aldolase class Ia